MDNAVKIGKFLSYILRHNPSAIDLTLDQHGWCFVDELLEKMNAQRDFHCTYETLSWIVEHNDKQRYVFDETKTRIRANQGHSIPVDVELKEAVPPPILYHGSATKYMNSIAKDGLLAQSRLYVHLSSSITTAKQVGARHGELVIYEVDCNTMIEDGHLFYLSLNQVWLTKAVAKKYLKTITAMPTLS